MELTLDAQRCDLGPEAITVPGYDGAKTADIDACREGRSLRITIPPTTRNDALTQFSSDPHALSRFNATHHTAELREGEAVLIAGSVRLLAVSNEGYTLEIRDGGAQWAQNAAQRMFNTLGVTYNEPLVPTTIYESWTNDSPVKFFPIHRDEYPQRNSSQDLLPAERMLSVDEYHPFLHLHTLVKTIFSEAGYRIRSLFLESAFFRSLYMSGAYSSRDTTAAANRMGFFARRLQDSTAPANHFGRVYANPSAIYSTVGNVVDTATPQTLDADGNPIPELMNNGGCFSQKEGVILFTPPTEISAGFEYYLRYTTDHRILSRTRLKGFDSMYLGPGSQMDFTLSNRYEDKRDKFTNWFSYLAIVFDHTPGAQYRLTCTRDGVAGLQWAEFAARTAQVVSPSSGTLSNPVLLRKNSSGSWENYTGDWALYNGYITETGQTTVEVRVRTAAEILTPESPKYFYQIYFEGAEEGMSFTLHKECSLKPRFLSSPGFGSTISFADVAQHRIRQSELLDGLQHLFNLRFLTDAATQTVFIEPADELFGAGEAVDWSDRSDFSQPVVREQIAPTIHSRRTWCYREGDGAVARFDAQNPSPLGQWSVKTDSYAAKMGEQVRRNPLFRPVLCSQGHYKNAPSAWIMQVGDRDAAEEDGTNFAPSIVRFAGMKALPAGERWGYPSDQAAYPLAAFHHAGETPSEGFTLCFEDRNSQSGLHRYYDRQVTQEATREHISLSLRLYPDEFESLLTPGNGAYDVRSAFRIDTGQGVVCATLLRIDDYDPTAARARCTFNRLTQD